MHYHLREPSRSQRDDLSGGRYLIAIIKLDIINDHPDKASGG